MLLACSKLPAMHKVHHQLLWNYPAPLQYTFLLKLLSCLLPFFINFLFSHLRYIVFNAVYLICPVIAAKNQFLLLKTKPASAIFPYLSSPVFYIILNKFSFKYITFIFFQYLSQTIFLCPGYGYFCLVFHFNNHIGKIYFRNII